jgi:hypothetical protein
MVKKGQTKGLNKVREEGRKGVIPRWISTGLYSLRVIYSDAYRNMLLHVRPAARTFVITYIHTRIEHRGRVSARRLAVLTGFFHGFPQSFQANSVIVNWKNRYCFVIFRSSVVFISELLKRNRD